MKPAIAAGAALLLSACASGPTREQFDELHCWKQQGLAVAVKNPAGAFWLGVLPGLGAFYVDRVGVGVVDLLLWPYSILWDPISSRRRANYLNYEATIKNADRVRELDLLHLENRHLAKAIDDKAYLSQKDDIEQLCRPLQTIRP